MEKYRDYNAEDLASLESFQNWFFKSKEEDISFWEDWISKNRATKENELTEAVVILNTLQFTDHSGSAKSTSDSWEELKNKLPSEVDQNHEIRPEESVIGKQKPMNNSLYWSIAACISIMIIAVFVFRGFNDLKDVEHKTGYGETKSITLPDNSTITLNSNSRLTYAEAWDESEHREVWLSGEAFFSIVHTPDDKKFFVHTNNGLNVEVIGTEFNVNDRKKRTRVVLNSGKIKLNINNERIEEQLIMKPGDLVEFKDTSKMYVKRIVNPEVYSSWKCKQLMFDNTTLEEVIVLLEDNYGLEVEVSDPALLQKEVSGSVPSNNTNLLMEGLAESFDLEIIWTKNHVKITPRH
ncbi:DUF4974 domain-containing protein [Fulvivirga sp. M361]|uniref:FecR family protein n=1 Tax=Fulvivirga sp. M361 TaxID=2594266 RepID=UPI00117A13E2|nr:FecR domain-containing protein [Fulvivirga sp. M361]TRX59942.1 DUF4974 domain-containing protein [Fulvivirga sp. M361]